MQGQGLPDMEDPAVLELLWCLLEADGEKLSAVKEPAAAHLGAAHDGRLLATYGALFQHNGSSFDHSWLSLTCDMDTKFIVSCCRTVESHNVYM